MAPPIGPCGDFTQRQFPAAFTPTEALRLRTSAETALAILSEGRVATDGWFAIAELRDVIGALDNYVEPGDRLTDEWWELQQATLREDG